MVRRIALLFLLTFVFILLLPRAPAAQTGAQAILPNWNYYTTLKHPNHHVKHSKYLKVGGHLHYRAFLRFDITKLQPGAQRYRFNILPTQGSSTGFVVRRGTGKSRFTRKLYVKVGPYVKNKYLLVDVTKLVGKRKSVTLALTSRSRVARRFTSLNFGGVPPSLSGAYPPAPQPPPTPPPPTPPPSSNPVTIAAVGDTCSPGSNPECAQTASTIKSINPQAFLHLGDLQYDTGTQSAIAAGYDKYFSSINPITYPVFGATHDFGWSGYPVAYMNTNSAAKGKLSDNQWGYSFDLGAWHVVALDYSHPDPAALEADLKAHPSQCLLATDHAPYIGTPSSQHSSNELPRSFVQPLFNHGVDLFLTGHNHLYERLGPTNIDLQPDPNGPSAFQVGTGGIGHYSFTGSKAPTSQVQNNTAFGVLKVVLTSTGWTANYVDNPGSSLTDSASGSCHP